MEHLIDGFFADSENLIVAEHDSVLDALCPESDIALLAMPFLLVVDDIAPLLFFSRSNSVTFGVRVRMMRFVGNDHGAGVLVVDNVHGVLSENVEVIDGEESDNLVKVSDRKLSCLRDLGEVVREAGS